MPENDYAALSPVIRKTAKHTLAVRSWFEANLKPLADTDHMFTREYRRFLDDVGKFNWEGTVTEEQLQKRWAARFDLERRVPDHPFEDGNCGWSTRKLAKFDYLGELNGGDWFRLTIKGGCNENDYSRTVTRVVKVVSADGRYQIANLFCL